MPITRFFLADHAANLRDKPAVVDDRLRHGREHFGRLVRRRRTTRDGHQSQ